MITQKRAVILSEFGFSESVSSGKLEWFSEMQEEDGLSPDLHSAMYKRFALRLHEAWFAQKMS